MLRDLFRRFRKDRKGVSAIEFAFVFPVLVTLVAGAWEVGRYQVAARSVSIFANQLALATAACKMTGPVTCQNEFDQIIDNYLNIAANVTPALGERGGYLAVSLYRVTRTSTGITLGVSSSVDFSYDATAGTFATSALQVGQSGIIVRVDYTYGSLIFTALGNQMLPSLRNFTQFSVALAI